MTDSDKNTTNKKSGDVEFAAPPFFKECPSYGFLYAIYKGRLLTLEEMIIIHRILIGCTKLIYDSNIKGAKKLAKEDSSTPKKLLASTSVASYHITMNMDTLKRRPSDYRRSLSEDIKNIQAADLSDILKSLSVTNIVTKTETDSVSDINGRKKRGRRRASEEIDTSKTGPKSFYQSSEYLKTLKDVISKPIARELIFSFLLESKLIYKWLDFICLYRFYLLKFGKTNTFERLETASRIDAMSETQLQRLFQEVSRLDDDNLRQMAHAEAVHILQHYRENEMLFCNLYLRGGILFNE